MTKILFTKLFCREKNVNKNFNDHFYLTSIVHLPQENICADNFCIILANDFVFIKEYDDNIM